MNKQGEPPKRMEYDVLKENTVGFQRNKFVEVSLKRIRGQEEQILIIAKGFYGPTGKKTYKCAFGIPADQTEVRRQLSEAILKT